MCGVVGIIGADVAVVRKAIAASADRLTHRGPDDGGFECVAFGNATLGLGFRRLSILDLSPQGHQPMIHQPTGCQIVFNGEIYNYRRLRRELEREGESFRSGTDTEILLAGLARHGERYLECLQGMFGFGFFDPRGPHLLLGRDPAGIKPLYIAENGNSLIFASEVRAIFATGLVKPQLDRRGVAGYLAYGAVQHPLTLFQGVKSLTPGSSVSIRPTNSGLWECAGTPRIFWKLPSTDAKISKADAIASIRETFDAAVEDHLVADVPVGLFLSSGLDSTIIAGLAAKKSPQLKTFTVCIANQPMNEQRIAAETARVFGLEHTELPVPMELGKEWFPLWLASLDEPSIDGFNVFVISRAVRSRGIKVALSGLGADELFGGYPSFRDVPRMVKYARAYRALPKVFQRGAAAIGTWGRSRAVQEKLRDSMRSDGSLASLYFHRRRVMSDSQLSQLGFCPDPLGLGPNYLSAESLWDIDGRETDLVRAISQLEFRCYQGNMLLRDADANGMAFGLEIRVPFLDQRLINIVHSIPGAYRLPASTPPKHLLRTAFKDLLRPEVLDQAKLGFTLPIGQWMAGDLRPLCESSLSALKSSELVEPDGVDAIWKSFLTAPQSRAWSRALALVVLGAFVERNVTTSI